MCAIFFSFSIFFNMKKKIGNTLLNIGILIFTFLVFYYSNITTTTFMETIWFILQVILPSLFPFMIFINFVLLSNCIDYLSILFKPLGKLFKISGYGITCVLASLLGGFPYSAILVSSFIKEKKINDKEAERLILSTFFPSFSFLFVSLQSLDKLFIYNIIALYLSSFLVLFITSFFKRYKVENVKNTAIIKPNFFTNIYFDVMQNSISSIFSISFCIIFFRLLSAHLQLIIHQPQFIQLMSGLLEFSSSSIALLSQPTKSFKDYLLLMNILSFSSFSILFQSYYYLKDTSINMKKLLLSRITICVLSSIIYTIIYTIFIGF